MLRNLKPQNIAEQKEMTLVQTATPSTYVRKGGNVGRPSNVEKVAKTKTKIDEFFAPKTGRQ
jgi:heptaprenylglyceryl phosphate synthase